MPNSGTLHGRNARIYLGITNASPILKIASNGTAVSNWEVQTGVDFQEDTGQGDVTKTYVPGLPDFSGSLQLFYQDTNAAAAQQFVLIDAAQAGTPVKFYGYPGIGAGVTNVYFYGTIYLALTSLPLDVQNLVTAAFDMRAGGAITFLHP